MPIVGAVSRSEWFQAGDVDPSTDRRNISGADVKATKGKVLRDGFMVRWPFMRKFMHIPPPPPPPPSNHHHRHHRSYMLIHTHVDLYHRKYSIATYIACLLGTSLVWCHMKILQSMVVVVVVVVVDR